ncbi:MAG TPA: S8 family peptidase [Puia sp.]|nr:S8 family peptidase [Puia sp.]
MNLILRAFFMSMLGVMTFSDGQTQDFVKLYHRADKAQGSRTAYLVKVKPGVALTGVRVLRQLSPSNYIVSAADSGLVANRSEWMLPANDNWKLSPSLMKTRGSSGLITLTVAVTDPAAFKTSLRVLHVAVRILDEYGPLLKLQCSRAIFMEQILADPGVMFADLSETPAREEQVLNDMDLTVNAINLAHRTFPSITGKGMNVSVREDRFDTADIDFRSRVLNTPLSSTLLSSHATIMATIIGGGGNSYYSGQGAAYRSTLSSFSFSSLLPDPDAVYRQYGISVQNHSYGSNIENYYGAEAVAHDVSAHNNPSLLHIFSAGNSGDQAATSGAYSGLRGLADLTGNYKMAKNILTVGSIDSFGAVSPLSSKGPAYDGRLKPELVAFGQDGSSGAAAIVSGIGLLLQQAYKEGHNGQLPSSDLVKAILLNSADDVGAPGIDYASGYGSVNAYRALKILEERNYFTGSLQAGEVQTYPLSVPAGALNLKITLVWNDVAAGPNAYTALVNDLDLELYNPATGATWLPWVLNSVPSADSLLTLPQRKRDSLNNAEQVTLESPPAGDYILRVRGTQVPEGPQSYSIAYQWDSLSSFKWAYPTGDDNISPGAANLLRWQTSFHSPALVEYSLDGGHQWTGIDGAVDLSRRNYYWKAPDTMATGLLRATIGGQRYYSDTFSISRPLSLSVGFNCPDSVFLYWNAGKGVSSYQVLDLGAQALEPLTVTGDTVLLFAKATHSSLYYAVAPLLPFGEAGVKSYTIGYTEQGVGCYLKSFTADPQSGREALLNLELGTLYQVQRISFEKQAASGFQTLRLIEPADALHYSVPDEALLPGVNAYRAKIELVDGQVVYSEVERVLYLAGKDHILYPNPLNGSSFLNVLSADLAPFLFQLYNVLGQKLVEKKWPGGLQQLPAGGLAHGVYFYRILKDGKQMESGKVVIN